MEEPVRQQQMMRSFIDGERCEKERKEWYRLAQSLYSNAE
jgi:hypothetical protein